MRRRCMAGCGRGNVEHRTQNMTPIEGKEAQFTTVDEK